MGSTEMLSLVSSIVLMGAFVVSPGVVSLLRSTVLMGAFVVSPGVVSLVGSAGSVLSVDSMSPKSS